MKNRTFNHIVRAYSFGIPVLMMIILIGGMLLIAHPTAVYAATYTVNTTADSTDADLSDGQCRTSSGECTLRAAIQQANATPLIDDEILVPSGTYVLTLGDIEIEDTVVISGTGATMPVIDGNGTDRIFTVVGNYENENTQITIGNLVLQNGNASSASYGNLGGAVLNLEILTLDHVEIRNSRAQEGGGVFHYGRDDYDYLTVIGSSITNNRATAAGGGINVRGKARIANSSDQVYITRIENNRAASGGGIFVQSDAEVILIGNARGLDIPLMISSNRANNSGGGIFNNATLTLDGVQVERNQVQRYHGGGIFNNRGSLTIRQSAISNNEARTPFTDTWNGHDTVPNYWGTGGGIANFNGGDITMSDSLMQSNTAVIEGGAMTNKGDGDITLERVTLSDNEVTGAWLQYFDPAVRAPEVYGNGGAIFSQSTGHVQIVQSRMIGNRAGHGGGALNNTAQLEIADTLFADNRAGTHPDSSGGVGGALYNYTGNVDLRRLVFRNNEATDSGGAIFNLSATTRIYDSAFVGNKALTQGGALYNTVLRYSDELWPAGVMELTNVTISGNVAGWRGGAILQNNENRPADGAQNAMRLTNVTIAENRAREYGGIAHVFSRNWEDWDNWDDSWIRNSIIADNFHGYVEGDPDSPGVVEQQCVSEGFPWSAPIASLGYNIASDDSCSSWFTQSSDRNNTDPRLGALEEQEGNGRELTTWVYPLLADSPAIDPDTSNGATDEDQRGFTRENQRDIGAFEVLKPVANDDQGQIAFPSPITIDLLTNDTDPDSDTLDPTSVQVTITANQGTIETHDDARITYTPAAGFNGTTTATYTVNDGHGHASNAATIAITVLSHSRSVAVPDSVSTNQNTSVIIDVLANDSATPGYNKIPDSVQIRTGSDVAPEHGAVTRINITTGAVTYRPDADFSGVDTFQYRFKANDQIWSNWAEITVNVGDN
ncbi:MAG: cadherin-like domain-containing protein [Chloroflexaceae bacterium]|nr:cadherin-like domain-containing protein [Chloroflexaceae bacterium]